MKNLKKIMLITLLALIIAPIPQQATAQKNRPVTKTEIRKREPHKKPEHKHAINDKDFSIIYNITKESSFDSDKHNIIRVACIGNYFTSKQCASLLSVFSFDDNKLKALKILAPRLIDNDYYNRILKQFTFSSSKDKATDILLRP